MSQISPPSAPIRVLIADDHPIVREGLAAIIERRSDMTVIAEARTGGEAIAMFRQYSPDVTLMDLRMPEMDGVTAIQALRKEFPDARVLVLTTFDGDDDIYRALHAGAMGYLLKDELRDKLLEAIRVVHSGKRFLPAGIAMKLGEHITTASVTDRERDVLRLVARGKSNQEIGRELSITEGTVKGHVVNILSKLEASDRTQAVTNAIKRGIIHLD